MTVQTATKMWSRHDGALRSEGGRRFHATIREAYQVVCDPTDTFRDVSNAPGLPTLGTVYAPFQQIRVTDLNPTQISPIYWIVEVTYTGNYGPGGGSSPLNELPDIKYGKREREIPVDEDWSGNAIVTANDEPLDVTRTVCDIVINIERNYAAVNLAATHEYLHSVNSDNFMGFSPGVVRLVDFSAKQEYAEESGGYWRVMAEFQCRWPYKTTAAKAWYARVLHRGRKLKVGSDIVNAFDDNGQPSIEPVLLASDGTLETDSSSAHWLEFQIYQPLPYNSLGLL